MVEDAPLAEMSPPKMLATYTVVKDHVLPKPRSQTVHGKVVPTYRRVVHQVEQWNACCRKHTRYIGRTGTPQLWMLAVLCKLHVTACEVRL